MIAVKTDDAIYMNVDSFFAGDGLSSMGKGLCLGCGDGLPVKVIDCNEKQAETFLLNHGVSPADLDSFLFLGSDEKV